MSNPLAAFRRYQQTLLVVFGIMLMIAWTVGARLEKNARTNEQPLEANKTAVTWKDGSLTQIALQRLRTHHQIALRFVQAAMQQAVTEGAPQQPFPLPVFEDDRNLLRNWLLAEQARKMGIQLSDDAVKTWLNLVTSGVVPFSEYNRILSSISQDRIGQDAFFDAMRTELCALQMSSMLTSGIYPSNVAPTPTVAWDLYNRLQRRVVFEFMPVAVSDFIDQVSPEPRESELKLLYEQYKDRLPDPRSPEPGFKLPLRRAFSYVRFDSDKGIEEEMAKVTDAEVQAYYDSHKEDFRASADLDSLLDTLGNPAAESTPDGTGTGTPPATETPATETPAPTEGGAEAASAESDASCGTEETDTEEASAEGKEEAVAEVSSVGTETGTAATQENAARGTDESTPSADESPQPVVYQPLEKVADQIKNSIASPRVAERVERGLTEVKQAMDDYYQNRLQWEIQSETSTSDPEPQRPDIAALSTSLGLQYEVIPLMDGMTFLESQKEFASTLQFVESGQQGFRREYLVQQAFSDATQPFRPIRFGNPGMGNEYVFWLTSESKEQVQEYSDCRAAVVRAWKLARAVEIARKKGEELANEARAAEKTLVDQFAGGGKYSVFVPDPDNGISWMSRNNLPINEGGDIFPSPVPDMLFAGWKTMQDIFRLNVGQYGVTVNSPGTTVYVVHIKEEKNDSQERRNRYLGPSVGETTYLMSMRERQQILQEQLDELEKSMELTWQVTPQM